MEESLKLFTQRYRSQTTALFVALSLGLFAMLVDMTWTAEANVPTNDGVTEGGEDRETSTIDIDSLYEALSLSDGESEVLSHISTPERALEGHISWYGPGFHGRLTANGERFNMHSMTAAHKKLPFNTIVRVVDTKTGKTILVRINDRGPYIRGRILDLSKEAARRLGMLGRGTTSGSVEIYPEQTVDERITAVSEGEESVVRFQTFNSDAQGSRPNGWSVQIGTFSSFEDGVNEYDRLRAEYSDVFLTRVSEGENSTWSVSVGLYGSRYLANNLLLELDSGLSDAAVITFENGYPVSQEATNQTKGV